MEDVIASTVPILRMGEKSDIALMRGSRAARGRL